MAKVKRENRSYLGSDAGMILASRVMLGFFKADLATFIEFDPSLGNSFPEAWLQKIEEASGVATDTEPLSEQAVFTRTVADTMEECKKHVKYLKYFVENALKDKPVILTQFGFDDYIPARQSVAKMKLFLAILYKMLNEYRTEIIAAGCSAEKIELTALLQYQLTENNYSQGISKNKRKTITQNRIKVLNECYEYMKKVSRAAKIVYADNYAKYNQYLLPKGNTKTANKTKPGEKPKDNPEE